MIYLLQHEHKHGKDTYAYSTLEKCRQALEILKANNIQDIENENDFIYIDSCELDLVMALK